MDSEIRHHASGEGRTSSPVSRIATKLRELVYDRLVLVLTMLFAAAGCFLLLHQARVQKNMVEDTVRDYARASADALLTFRTLYTSEVVSTVLKQGIVVTHDYETREGAIPLPATLSMKLGDHMGKIGSEVRSRLYSPYPFPWRREEGGLSDEFSRQAWEALTKAPGDPFFRIEKVNGRLSLRFATADLMRPACVNCHNTHPDTPKADWKVGDLRGILEVSVPMDLSTERSRSLLLQTATLFVVLGSVAVFGLALTIGQLRRISKSLERQVRERTAELTQSNVQLSQEVADRIRAEQARKELITELEGKNAELERYTYTVSHDLKSPLVTITGFAGLLEKNAAAGNIETQRTFIGRIVTAAKQMARLLDDVVDLSRIGRFLHKPEDVSLAEVAREAETLCAGQIAERGVEIEIAADLPILRADRIRLLEAMQNLLDNAIKFMGDQPNPRIEIGVRREDGETVCYILDNGIGINPKYTENVFRLFEQLDPAEDGTGIGLALVKRIMEFHGGRIWVESAGLGHGSTFCFVLPSGLPQAG